MKILKIQKISKSKYKIILDNKEIITFDNVILEYNLLYKKELSNDKIIKILNDTKYYEIYNKALKYVTTKMHSKKEIIDYLYPFDITDQEKNKIIKKLSSLNLINDELYCRSFINDKINISKYGLKKIENMLKKKGIDYNIIQHELEKVDYNIINSNLELKIKRKINSNKRYTNYELRQKLLLYFLNEGYNKETINNYIDKYFKNDDEILKYQFNKLYYKYKKKYKDEIFLLKLRQKLLQKGFCNELINKLLEEKTEE